MTSEYSKTLFLDGDEVRILGQIWQSYILLEGKNTLYCVDQHAVAERIAFEKMKQEVKEKGFETEILLSPLAIVYPAHIEEEQLNILLEQLNAIGFDISDFGNQKLIIHAIPKVFAKWKVDIELVMNFVW